jgi:hypothetical protein
MTEHRFDVGNDVRFDVRLPVGEVRIVSGSGTEAVVTLDGRPGAVDRFTVERRGDVIYVEPDGTRLRGWSSVDLVLQTPVPASVHARVTAADLIADVDLESLAVESAAGDISAEGVTGDLDIKSASGDIRVKWVGGRAAVSAASGDVRIDRAGEVNVKTASGDVFVGSAAADVVVKSASGDVVVGRFEGTRFDGKSMSGDVIVGVTGGRRYEVSFSSLSGDIRTDFPVADGAAGASAHLDIKTVSGDIKVKSAKGG